MFALKLDRTRAFTRPAVLGIVIKIHFFAAAILNEGRVSHSWIFGGKIVDVSEIEVGIAFAAGGRVETFQESLGVAGIQQLEGLIHRGNVLRPKLTKQISARRFAASRGGAAVR